MSTDHPHRFDIPLDRKALRQQALRSARRGWLLIVPGLFVGFALLLSIPITADEVLGATVGDYLSNALKAAGGTAAGVMILGGIAYGFARRHARLSAEHIQAHVEGPYLCVRSGAWQISDAKYHFRALHDYAVIRRYDAPEGPADIRIGCAMTGNQQGVRGVVLPQVIDAEHWRDVLAEVDAAREL